MVTVDQVREDNSRYIAAVGAMPQDTDKLYVEYLIGEGICGYSRYVPFAQVRQWAREKAVERGVDLITMLAPH